MEKRQMLPEGTDAENAFVLGALRQNHGGKLTYSKLNSRYELCVAFWIRKADYDRLIATIKRLVETGSLSRSVVETRSACVYRGWTSPASREVTLAVPIIKSSERKQTHVRSTFALP